MPKRRATISYRIPEELRARIEEAATEHGVSMTREITRCIEQAQGAISEAKRHPLSMRTTKRLRDRLDEAAALSGRSLAQEVEARLQRSFDLDEMRAVVNEVVESAITRRFPT